MPHAPVAVVALEIWTGICTQIFPALQEVVPLVLGHTTNEGCVGGGCTLLGSSCDCVKAALTALTAFNSYCARLFGPVQVTQEGTDPARAPSWAARLIAP